MAATIGAARIELSANSASFESDMARARAAVGRFEKSLGNVQKKFERTGRKMERIGHDLQQKVTLPILAVGAASLKASADFESAFAGVRKTVDASENDFAALRSGIQQMSKELPASAAEIAGVMEVAGQLGVRGVDNLMSFTRTAVNMGNATNVAAGAAAEALSRIDKIMGGNQTTFDRLGSAVVAIGNNFATTEDRIFDATQRLAGIGKVAGLTQAQLVGVAGAVTSTSDRVESASTAISKVLSTMTSAVSSGSKELGEIARIAGTTATQFQRAFRQNAAVALADFIEGLEKARERGEDVFTVLDRLGLSGERVSQNILALAGANDTLRSAIGQASKAWEDNTALTEEAQKRYKTFNSFLQTSWNRIVNVAAAIGEKLMPVARQLVGMVVSLVEGFGQLSPATQKMIIGLAGLAAVIPPLLATLGFLTSSIIPAMAAGFAALAGPAGIITGVVTVIGLLAGAFLEHKTRVSEATSKQRAFIDALKEGNKTMREARASVSGLTLTDELAATKQLIAAQKQRISQQEELIKRQREGGTMAGMTIAQLKQLEGARRAADMQGLLAQEKELERLEQRSVWMRQLIENENRLRKARAIAEQTNSSVAKQDIYNLEKQNRALKEQLGLIEQVNDETQQAASQASSGFTAGIGFNFSDLPLNQLRSQFAGVYEELRGSLNAIQAKDIIFPDFDGRSARIDAIKGALNSLVEQGVDPASKAVGELLDQLGRLQDPVPTGGLAQYKVEIEGLGTATEEALRGTSSSWEQNTERIKQITDELNAFLASQISGGITAMAQNIGQSLAGVGNEMATGLEKVMLIVLDFAAQLGQVLTAIGTAFLFIPGAQGQGAALIAAGATLTVLAAGLKAGIEKRMTGRQKRADQQGAGVPQMAAGAVVSAPTLAVVGDNPNAGRDPEVVAPLSKLESIMGGRGGGRLTVDGEFRIKGTDLVVVLERAKKSYK